VAASGAWRLHKGHRGEWSSGGWERKRRHRRDCACMDATPESARDASAGRLGEGRLRPEAKNDESTTHVLPPKVKRASSRRKKAKKVTKAGPRGEGPGGRPFFFLG